MTLHGQEKMQTQKRSNLESDFQSFYNIRFECPVCKKNLQYIVTYSSKKKYKNFLYLRILQTYLSMTLLVDLGKMWVYRNVLGYPLFHHYV